MSYPKPGPTGGTLIREVIQTLKKTGLSLPIDSHILIACSGGPDSMALTHLLLKYGRRIIPSENLTLLHVNHGWRGEASEEDQELLVEWAKKWNVPVILKRAEPPAKESKESWENHARDLRKKIYRETAKKWNAQVLTAHHADDLAETLLWRLFTGASQTHGEGIRTQEGIEIRPFLKTRKETLKQYLKEEKVPFREDSSNQDPRFLRARLRKLLPELEKIFPKMVDHLVQLGLEAKKRNEADSEMAQWFFQAAQIHGRRPHFEAIEKLAQSAKAQGSVDLPKGWRLTKKGKETPQWLLEKKSRISS